MLGAFVASLLVAPPGSAIESARITPLQLAVAEAEQKWRRAAPYRYSYRLVSGGPFGYTTYLISVDGDMCSAKSRSTSGRRVTRWKRASCAGRTFNEVFVELRRQLAQPQERIELNFDPLYGYPTKASFQPHSGNEDQSEYFETSSFKVPAAKSARDE